MLCFSPLFADVHLAVLVIFHVLFLVSDHDFVTEELMTSHDASLEKSGSQLNKIWKCFEVIFS
jgi:hypothetical protein